MQNMGHNDQKIDEVKLDLGRQLFGNLKVQFFQTLLICQENPPEKFMVSPLTHFKSISQRWHVEIVLSPRKFPAIQGTLKYSILVILWFTCAFL